VRLRGQRHQRLPLLDVVVGLPIPDRGRKLPSPPSLTSPVPSPYPVPPTHGRILTPLFSQWVDGDSGAPLHLPAFLLRLLPIGGSSWREASEHGVEAQPLTDYRRPHSPFREDDEDVQYVDAAGRRLSDLSNSSANGTWLNGTYLAHGWNATANATANGTNVTFSPCTRYVRAHKQLLAPLLACPTARTAARSAARTAPHRTASHRIAPHRTAPHRTASKGIAAQPHCTAPHRTAPH
jgi:hypothetical protein